VAIRGGEKEGSNRRKVTVELKKRGVVDDRHGAQGGQRNSGFKKNNQRVVEVEGLTLCDCAGGGKA